MSNIRYFKDSETDNSWTNQGILYIALNTETDECSYHIRGGSCVLGVLGRFTLDQMIEESIIIEIPASEAVLIS
jgi:hypothetical protein